jgi:hypothetical protein
MDSAAEAGDPSPTSIQHSAVATRAQANLVDSGDVVPGDNPSYLIAMRGHFVSNGPRPQGAASPTGSVMTLVVDATTGKVADVGLEDTYPDLAKLGPVVTDLRITSHRASLPRKAAPSPGASPTPANQPALDAAANDARALAGHAYYTEAAINLKSDTVDVYLDHAPAAILDRLQALHPGTYVFHNTTAHPRSALLRLEDSISVSYWETHGVRISYLGPRRDGYLEIGVTSALAPARSKLSSAYGANWIRVVYDSEPPQFLSSVASPQATVRVELVVTVNHGHRGLARYTLSCPAGRGSFPHAGAACRTVASTPAMVRPPKLKATCVGSEGVPPEVSVQGTVGGRHLDFSVRACDVPFCARASCSRLVRPSLQLRRSLVSKGPRRV